MKTKLSCMLLIVVFTANALLFVVKPLAMAEQSIIPPQGDSSWKLVFSDEFNGDSLDTTKWNYNYPWGETHNHRAYCAKENVSVSDGYLKIKAENKRHPSAPSGVTQGGKWYSLDYTSGAINTKNKFEMTAGYIEGRFKIPGTKGFWPAFWTLNANGSWPPEIDILEVLCHAPQELHTNYHYGPSWDNKWSHYQKHTVSDLSQDFHTYAVEWAPNYMKWYLDGKQIGTSFNNAEWINQSNNMYLIINLAIGGWESDPDNTTIWPSNYECDWVRVWQRSGMNGGFESGSLSPWYAWNDASVVNSNARTGSYSLRLGNGPASAEQVITVKPNTTYTFSGYGKVPAGQTALIGVKNFGGPQTTYSVTSTNYSEGKVTFTTGTTNTSATIFFYHQEGAGYCYGDDFQVQVQDTVQPTPTPTNTPTPSLTSIPSPTGTGVVYGDVNGDNKVNSVDFAYMRMKLLGMIDEFPYSTGIIAADVNRDGEFNSIDFALVRMYLLGFVDSF